MNLLILTRHFPPFVSGGARRPYLLVRGLRDLGENVRVIAPALPDDIQGISVPHPAPVPVDVGDADTEMKQTWNTGLRNWIRANLFLPDPDIRWALRTASRAKQLGDFRPDWIISTSPPESLHVAAFMTARHYQCRWAADFRDHWLIYPLIREREGMLRRMMERRLAKSLLSRADLLFSPEMSMLEEISAYAPSAPTLHLPQAGSAVPSAPKNSNDAERPITILHTGSFSLSHDKRSIVPALNLIAEARTRSRRFKLVLIGRLTTQEIAEAEATDGVEIRGILGLEDTWRAQAEADILLNIAAPDALTPPGKLAEYQATGLPIIFLGGNSQYKKVYGGNAPAIDQLMQAVKTPATATKTTCPTPKATAEKLLETMTRIDNCEN